MKRRVFLGLIAVTVISGADLAATASGASARSKLPKVLVELPSGHKKSIAWTIDDGVSSSAVAAFVKLARDQDLRLTFFVTSAYESWRKNAKLLRPLVQSGQIQLANHTKTHVDLTSVSDDRIRQELLECERFIKKVYGVDPKPYFRPPYGYYNDRVLRVAAEIGYTKPVMWFGVLADSASTRSYRILTHAKKWLVGGRIVIDHANSANTVADFSRILQILRARGLKTVTLNDVWPESASGMLGASIPAKTAEPEVSAKGYFFNTPGKPHH